jgi:hypothetical protein
MGIVIIVIFWMLEKSHSVFPRRNGKKFFGPAQGHIDLLFAFIQFV